MVEVAWRPRRVSPPTGRAPRLMGAGGSSVKVATMSANIATGRAPQDLSHISEDRIAEVERNRAMFQARAVARQERGGDDSRSRRQKLIESARAYTRKYPTRRPRRMSTRQGLAYVYRRGPATGEPAARVSVFERAASTDS